MSFLNLFGSESHTDQTAYNQQVGASQGSIAFGARSAGNTVNIQSVDPAVVEASLESQNVTTGQALGAVAGTANLSIGAANDLAGKALGAVAGTANLSIGAANDLAGKFMSALQKSYAGSQEFASASLTAATNAEHSALAQSLNAVSALSGQVANIAAEQTPGGLSAQATKTTSDTVFKLVLVAALAVVAISLLGKK